MSFNGEFEKYIKQYNEGILDTLWDVTGGRFTDPVNNPWVKGGYRGSGSKSYRGSKLDTKGEKELSDKNLNLTNGYRIKGLQHLSTNDKFVVFKNKTKRLGEFKLNASGVLTKSTNLNNILVPKAALAPNIYKDAVDFFAAYDLNSLNLISGNAETDIKNFINSEIKRTNTKGSLFGGKERELFVSMKNEIESYLSPLVVPAQKNAFIIKATWFFILTRKNVLQK